jgi:hypothetical protein
MANRAYLYSADRPDKWDTPDEGYYDSRWTIPLAWFYFFGVEDVHLVDVRYGGSHWQEVKVSADKNSALALFEARTPLLLSIIGRRLSSDEVAKFMSAVGGRPGSFLLMDPVEVLGGMSEDDHVHAGRFTQIFTILGTGGGPPDAARDATRPYVGDLSPDPVRCECQVLGFTY